LPLIFGSMIIWNLTFFFLGGIIQIS
jgi:hypothetical protein